MNRQVHSSLLFDIKNSADDEVLRVREIADDALFEEKRGDHSFHEKNEELFSEFAGRSCFE
jgi:hypothetical protein